MRTTVLVSTIVFTMCDATPSTDCLACRGLGFCRYVLRGCAREPEPCEADDPRAEECRECEPAAAPLVCDGCEGRLPETPFALGTDVYCDACALALCAEVVRGGSMTAEVAP